MPDPRPHLKLVRLNARERADLFNKLERRASSASASRPAHTERRRDRRWEYQRDDVWLTVEHPGGGVSRFVILTRNLSAHGIAFIHGSFVHATTHCQLILKRHDGTEFEVTGRVIAARHLEGALHEVRLRFDETIEPCEFVGFGDQTIAISLEPDDLKEIHGRVLYLQDADVHAHLLARHLEATSMELTRVKSDDQARAAVRSGDFESILVDLTFDGVRGTSVIGQIREDGYEGPIVLLTAEVDEVRVAAMAAGADHVLRKPYRPEELYMLLIRLHLQELSGEVIYSTIDPAPDTLEMLGQYIDHARDLADRLDGALGEQNLDRMRSECLNLKGSAAGYGFDTLGREAESVLHLLDRMASLEDTLQQVRKVSQMCRQLAVKDV